MYNSIKHSTYVFMLGLFVIGLYPQESNAIPAFARKNNIACSSCHSAWPMLNDAGRRYKENGYRFSNLEKPGVEITDNLRWDESLPVSVVLVARPYDKKDSGERKVRAIHEAELMVGGPMGEKMSGFFEIEAEDEFTNDLGFDVSIPAAVLTYNQSKAINIQFSYADILWFDSYNTFSHARRLTRGVQSVVSDAFGGADNGGSLDAARQNLALYGRPVNNLFYGVSLSGVADDAEGVDAQTMLLRVALDVSSDLMIGGLLIDGTCSVETGLAACSTDRDYRRMGVDAQVTLDKLVLTGVYMQAEDDDATAVITEENKSSYIQAAYMMGEAGATKFLPLVRYDMYEKNDGSEDITELTVSFRQYFTENISGFIEYWDRSGEKTTSDDDRLTLQLMAAF